MVKDNQGKNLNLVVYVGHQNIRSFKRCASLGGSQGFQQQMIHVKRLEQQQFSGLIETQTHNWKRRRNLMETLKKTEKEVRGLIGFGEAHLSQGN